MHSLFLLNVQTSARNRSQMMHIKWKGKRNMPRFQEQEKERIRSRLHTEGERLFVSYGLKKVTIDDLVSAVNIAKATFYTFYESKEYLYLDIVQEIQRKIIAELDELLDTHSNLTGRQRVRLVFQSMYLLMQTYPILSQMDSSTVELISRKVSKERLSVFTGQNVDAVLILAKHDIRFTCSPETASAVFLALYQGWISLQHMDQSLQEETADILLNGVIEQIVAD